MSLPVLIGFAGVLVAAVATGMLAGRCARQPRTGFIVWTAATLGLTIALAAQSIGFASGFGPATFRAVQLLALLLAPLWLAWGLVEVAIPSDTARFGMRLISAALTVVASVILATDPLGGPPFSKAWPLTSLHFQPIALYALDAVQAVAVLALVAAVAVAATRRPGPPPQAARSAQPPAAGGPAQDRARGGRLGRPGRAHHRRAAFLAPGQGGVSAAQHGCGGARVVRCQQGRRARGARRGRARPPGRPRPTVSAAPGPARAAGRPAGRSPGGPRASGTRRGRPVPAAGAAVRGRPPGGDQRPGGRGRRRATRGVQPAASAAGSPAAAPARPYGRILIFTLLEDRVAEFDRLAEEAAEQVRIGEPDTLVYVIHLVPNAPMQRIFYEIYRDRAAFDSHETQPYIQRFVADRRSCVLATNVIELRLKYAKVAPLPGPPPAAPPPRSRPAGCRGPRCLSGPGRCPRPARSVPTSRGTTSRGYDQAPAALGAPDERRPDQRQVPSARPYGG